MEAFAALLQNPLVLTLIGVAVKYWPPLGKLANGAIPYLNTLLALLGVLAVPAAHAGVLGIGGWAGGFLSPILTAAWTAVQSALIYEIFGRHPLEKGLGWKKALAK
ncbi:MAG: hypothetical protein A2Z30_03355 [Chloroflexi bacterium RBG_16_64_43]|nr:MAG: hypothetical protein A2Z30_03355 [Chloroflexi bacterium RBG_16_64_43]